jgi:hypothetical protein
MGSSRGRQLRSARAARLPFMVASPFDDGALPDDVPPGVRVVVVVGDDESLGIAPLCVPPVPLWRAAPEGVVEGAVMPGWVVVLGLVVVPVALPVLPVLPALGLLGVVVPVFVEPGVAVPCGVVAVAGPLAGAVGGVLLVCAEAALPITASAIVAAAAVSLKLLMGRSPKWFEVGPPAMPSGRRRRRAMQRQAPCPNTWHAVCPCSTIGFRRS